MLEIQKLRENAEGMANALGKRGLKEAAQTIDRILEIDVERRAVRTETESLRAEMNATAKRIGELMRNGQKEEADQAKSQTSDMKSRIQQLTDDLNRLEEEQDKLLLTLPNTPHDSVPAGVNEDDNKEVYRHGKEVQLGEGALPHWDLARKHDIIDWEAGVKLTGSGFPVYKGKGAKLLRALIRFFLDQAESAGYEEFVPPLVVNEESGYGTGQLPDKEGQMYEIPLDKLYLIPTAEVPITNLFRGDIVAAEDLPIRCCGYTQCFRREAGAYGKDVRGLNRLHQFDKVEIVEIAHPDTSYDRLTVMLEHAKGLLEKLELPYRVLLLCGGDTSFASAKTFDLEVWSGAQNRWLEVSSVSCFETFQANRLKLRYRDENGKTQLAHTLNGSALALPRVMAALLENNQQADGSIRIPKVLQPYTGYEQIG